MTEQLISLEEISYPQRGQIWKHYKGGNYYIRGLVVDTKTGNYLVRYTELHEKMVDGSITEFVREIGEFIGMTSDHQKRFTLTPRKLSDFNIEFVNYIERT
jgi:hypothetical protein